MHESFVEALQATLPKLRSRSTGASKRYGPGRVICNEGRKVVRISHRGHLICASREQLRSASIREWQAVQSQGQDSSGVSGEVVRGTRRVFDLIGGGELPTRRDVDMEGDSPIRLPDSPASLEIPENEDKPKGPSQVEFDPFSVLLSVPAPLGRVGRPPAHQPHSKAGKASMLQRIAGPWLLTKSFSQGDLEREILRQVDIISRTLRYS